MIKVSLMAGMEKKVTQNLLDFFKFVFHLLGWSLRMGYLFWFIILGEKQFAFLVSAEGNPAREPECICWVLC